MIRFSLRYGGLLLLLAAASALSPPADGQQAPFVTSVRPDLQLEAYRLASELQALQAVQAAAASSETLQVALEHRLAGTKRQLEALLPGQAADAQAALATALAAHLRSPALSVTRLTRALTLASAGGQQQVNSRMLHKGYTRRSGQERS